MSKRFNGFTATFRAFARCPSGHEVYLDAEMLVPPQDTSDMEQHAKTLKLYLQQAYSQLTIKTCKVCDKENETYWR